MAKGQFSIHRAWDAFNQAAYYAVYHTAVPGRGMLAQFGSRKEAKAWTHTKEAIGIVGRSIFTQWWSRKFGSVLHGPFEGRRRGG